MQKLIARIFPRTVADHLTNLDSTVRALRTRANAQRRAAFMFEEAGRKAREEQDRAARVAMRIAELIA